MGMSESDPAKISDRPDCGGIGWAQPRRPLDTIVMLTGDPGYGNAFNETLNLDRLARVGVRFAHAYAAEPVCSPARVSYMTGQFPAHTGINVCLRTNDPMHLWPLLSHAAQTVCTAGNRTALIGSETADAWRVSDGSTESGGCQA